MALYSAVELLHPLQTGCTLMLVCSAPTVKTVKKGVNRIFLNQFEIVGFQIPEPFYVLNQENVPALFCPVVSK